MPPERPAPRDRIPPRGGAGGSLRDALDLVGDQRRPSRPAPEAVPRRAPRAAPRPAPAEVAPRRRLPAGGVPGSRQRSAEPAPRPSRPGTARPAFRRRLRFATVVALGLYAVIGVRLVVLQVGQSPQERAVLAAQQRSRVVEIELPAARGSIVDRTGAVLARSVEARYVYADPELVRDARTTAARLSPLLGIAPSRLVRLMARTTLPGGTPSRFAYLARGVEVPVAEHIDALRLAGVGTSRDERRVVPGADLAANLIGFTGDDHTGLEGLEARYDTVLHGRDGKLSYERGNPGVDGGKLAKEIPSGHHRRVPARPGATLHLTIDRDLQFTVQRALCTALDEAKATSGAGVVLDVETGEVLVQASCPAFDAGKPLDYRPAERADVASSVAAEPGSTHKAFVIAAALQEGVITADTTVPADTPVVRGGVPFSDDQPRPDGSRLTVPQVLAYSSNVGTIAIADRLGPQRIYDYQRRFGLGSVTHEGMPGEAAGRLLPPHRWSGSASGSVPIGASVDATLVQMAAGYAAIANDGTYVEPRLVTATVDAAGVRTPAPPPRTRRVLSPAVAAQVRTMMEAVVVLPGATGRRAAVPGYRVAGKTGTIDRLAGGADTGTNAVSFIGMAPAEAPRYVVAVSATVAEGAGGDVAAPAFSTVMGLTLGQYRVPPSTTGPPSFD